MEEINISDFLRYLKKYIYIIALVGLLLLSIVYVYDSVIKTPKYTTYTTILIIKEHSSDYDSTSLNDITLNQKLVPTYREFAKSKLVLNQVITALDLDYTVEELAKEIKVEAITDTEILKLSVIDKDPKTAALIANTTAEIFEREANAKYGLNNFSIVDVADMPVEPSNNTLFRDLVLAIVVTIIGGTGVVFVIFYFDDTLVDSKTLEAEIEMPVIARVYKDTSKTELLALENPSAMTSECIRTLRANLQFSSVDQELQTILVTSTMPSEGKSFISSNLAISFAQAGKKVLLIDCDLRKGRQHHIFDIVTKNGLSNLLVEDINNYESYINPTKVENLWLIARGAFPPNPSELLSSKKLKKLLNLLKDNYDVIILDGAPCSGLSDSLTLSTVVDRVLLVCSNDYTQKKALKQTKKDLDGFRAKIAGVVVNNVKHQKGGYGYYYNYGYGEHKDND